MKSLDVSNNLARDIITYAFKACDNIRFVFTAVYKPFQIIKWVLSSFN